MKWYALYNSVDDRYFDNGRLIRESAICEAYNSIPLDRRYKWELIELEGEPLGARETEIKMIDMQVAALQQRRKHCEKD